MQSTHQIRVAASAHAGPEAGLDEGVHHWEGGLGDY